MINTEGLNKAEVLAALYNNSHPQGMGFLHYNPVGMTKEEAEQLLTQTTYFDYLSGRVMKVNLKDDAGFDEYLYDRDCGAGAAQKVIDELRSGQKQEENHGEQPVMTEDAARDKALERVACYMTWPDIVESCERRNIPLMKGKKERKRYELEEELIKALTKEYVGEVDARPAPAMFEGLVK